MQALYAIIRVGGKQYRVQAGDTIRVERMTSPAGEKVRLEQVLLIGDGDATRVGQPHLEKAAVAGTVLGEGRGNKVRVFKYKKRKHYRRTRGHRQAYTTLRIDSIEG
jgi:large subunit ribosomal protein L21